MRFMKEYTSDQRHGKGEQDINISEREAEQYRKQGLQRCAPEYADTGDQQYQRNEAERPVDAEAGKGGRDIKDVQRKVADREENPHNT